MIQYEPKTKYGMQQLTKMDNRSMVRNNSKNELLFELLIQCEQIFYKVATHNIHNETTTNGYEQDWEGVVIEIKTQVGKMCFK